MESDIRASWYAVNSQLIPVKGIYFFFLAAVGALLPYITVYMKQLLLTPTETGIIYGVMPFISFFVRPLIGALADKTKRHKLVLIVCTLLTGIFYCMLLLTPTKEIRSTKVVTGFECNTYDSFVSDCSPSFEPENNKKDSCPSEVRLVDFFNEYIKGNDSSIECSLTCNRVLVSNDDLQVCFTNDIQSINEDSCENWKASGNSVLNFSVNLNRVIDDKIIPTNLSGQGQSCENYNLKNVSFRGQMYWQAVCNMETLFKCEVTCNAYHTKACELDNFGKTFWIFFVIFLFGNIAFAPVLSLVDAIAYDMLGERRGFWGIQRMWGTVGFAIFAIGSGIGNKILSDMNISVHFSVSFLLFLGLTVASSAITLFLKFSENIHCSQIFQNTCQLLKSYKIAVFFVLIASFGIMNAVTEAFLYWYVMLLGGNTITIGLCLLANCLPEILVLFFSGAIIKKIGHMTCFCMGLFSYVIRFFAYSIITDPWLIIPVELIHCLSFALMYAAASSYASMIAPEGTMATMQGLVGGLYFGFGKGIGSIVTGSLFDPVTGIGPVWTFRAYGFFALALFILYSLLCFFLLRGKDTPTKTRKANFDMAIKNGPDGDNTAVGELLLGANSVNNENADL